MSRPVRNRLPLLLVIGLLAALLPTAAIADSHVFTATDHASLVQAINDGNASGAAYEVFIDIEDTLTITDDLPNITEEATIRGRSAAETIVDGNGYRLFVTSQDLTLADLTVTDADDHGDLDGSVVRAIGGEVLVRITDSILDDNHADEKGGAIFVEAETAQVIVERSTLSNNTAGNDAGAIHVGGDEAGDTAVITVIDSHFVDNISGDDGGALYARGRDTGITNVFAIRSFFSGNEADDDGGAIYARSEDAVVTVEIHDSHFDDNEAGGTGGAIRARSNTDAAVLLQVDGGSTFTGNQADHEAGAIYAEGDVHVAATTFSDNHALGDDGGAIRAVNSVTAVHSTFAGNTAADEGGAIKASNDEITAENSTFTGNASAIGGAIWAMGGQLSNTTVAGNTGGGGVHGVTDPIELVNSIVWGNASGDCSGAIDATGGHNLGGDATCGLDPSAGDVTGQDPKLSPLADNGGLTQTMALAADSPAVDAGDDATCLATDQRGVSRPQGEGCDIGAFEVAVDDEPAPVDGIFCPPGLPPSGFTDVGRESVHATAIDCLVFREITRGITDTLYGPARSVTRGQMASFVVRTLRALGADLPAPSDQGYEDVPDNYVHADAINQLTALGIVQGRTPTTFAPNRPVRRDQVATFVAGAVAYATGETLPDGPSVFPDVDPANVHLDNISRLAAAEIALGRQDGNYRPRAEVRRDQMASFIVRMAQWVLDADG